MRIRTLHFSGSTFYHNADSDSIFPLMRILSIVMRIAITGMQAPFGASTPPLRAFTALHGSILNIYSPLIWLWYRFGSDFSLRCESRSGFPTVLRIRDPMPFWPLGSGMGKKSGSGSGIRNEKPGSYFLELRNNFLGLKYLNSLMRILDPDPGWTKFGSGILDGKKSDPESGKTARIRKKKLWYRY